MKLGRFDDAYDSLHALRRSTAYTVHPRAERTYMDLRYAYMQHLTARTKRLPSLRLHNELEDKHAIPRYHYQLSSPYGSVQQAGSK